MLKHLIDAKPLRWAREAELEICGHDARGGEFTIERWANGVTMASIPGTLANRAITLARFNELKANGWRILC